MLEQLSNEYVQKLNADYRGGIFVKAVDFEEDPSGPVMRYWVDYPTPITYNGNLYNPLFMVWSNMKTSQGMSIDAATISVSNLTTEAGKYVKEFDVTDNLVITRLLHIDLLNQINQHWFRALEVISVAADPGLVIFSVGRRLSRSVLPRKVYLQKEFPGLTSETPKILG